ncbi:HAD-IIA family hydrolase [Clostridium sp.]|jgi:4-nitrophenyl phosphatase|uniref:HAD-IIA family hydrolase n=1 Tax=Clostridium sp. TaxID=1506 RepID=UPI003A5BEFE3
MNNKIFQNQDKINEILKKIKCYILDLDGTVYLGNKILDGSLDFFKTLEKNNIKFKFFTNNSSKNAQIYVNKITKMGYAITEDMMLISNQVIIEYIKKNMPDKKVFILGNKYLKGDFLKANINVVEDDAEVVVVGFDTSLTYENVSKACDLIRKGAKFLGVNPDFNCPVENGFIPDCGSICKMITASTGVEPEFFGKPTHHTLEYILNNTGLKESEIAIIGDRLYTDIAIANGNDLISILVLTGETKIEDLEKSEIQPKLIFNSLGELSNYLKNIIN